MTKLFYFSEIVKFAIEKEQESFDLYTKMAALVSDDKIKKIFQTLIKQEEMHKAYYTEILDSIKVEQSSGVKEDDEYKAYMDELIAESRTTPAIKTLNFKDINQVLDYAIAREKDSVLFYVGLKNFAPASAQEHINVIINEEEHHATVLIKLKEWYKDK